jgi:hypothetical protein
VVVGFSRQLPDKPTWTMLPDRPPTDGVIARRDDHATGDDDKHTEGNLARSKQGLPLNEAARVTKAQQPLNFGSFENGKRLPTARLKN